MSKKKPIVILVVIFVFLTIGGRFLPRLVPGLVARSRLSPVARAKDRLLALHPHWRMVEAGGDPSFQMRGYLALRPGIDLPIEYETLTVLGKGSPEEISASKLAELREELREQLWHGLVYMKRARPKEKEGWHGRVLVRAECLFFGDMEMLEEIDKDLR